MNNDKWVFGVGGLVLGIVLTWVFATSAVNGNRVGMMNMMGLRSGSYNQNLMASNIDQHFIEQMIPHHDDAISMANIALTKAEHREIKDLSQNIIKAQTEENDMMKEWYKSWFGGTVPDIFANTGHGMGSGIMHGGMMGSSSDLANLESAKPFDKEFIEQMIPHHQRAIMMAQMLKTSTSRSEMKELADNIINAQTEEINQMRGWYSQWYK